jgi:F-type H+-transporting ATPase subunit b
MEKLGIEPVQLLTQIVNFVVMVVVLTKFLYKPILRTLDDRKKKIEEGLRYAEEMKEAVAKNEKKRKEIIEEAKDEGQRIIAEARESGRRLEEEIVVKAKAEAQTIVEKGKNEIASERVEMEKQLRKQTVDVAAAMTATLLGSVATKRMHQEIIDKKLASLAKAMT